MLVVTRDQRTSRQVEEFLSAGSDVVLGRMFNKCLGEKYGHLTKFSEEEPKEVKHKGQGKKSVKAEEEEVKDQTEQNLKKSVSSVFHALDSCESFDTFIKLMELKPRYIILYDCDMTFVRQVEVYQASNSSLHVRVYFMLYKGSVEEQAYLTAISPACKPACFPDAITPGFLLACCSAYRPSCRPAGLPAF